MGRPGVRELGLADRRPTGPAVSCALKAVTEVLGGLWPLSGRQSYISTFSVPGIRGGTIGSHPLELTFWGRG